MEAHAPISTHPFTDPVRTRLRAGGSQIRTLSPAFGYRLIGTASCRRRPFRASPWPNRITLFLLPPAESHAATALGTERRRVCHEYLDAVVEPAEAGRASLFATSPSSSRLR